MHDGTPTLPLPDQIHIDRLRDALWSGRESGRAAAMVGAGFSRNARRVRAAARPFPTWSELTNRLADGLYGMDARRRDAAVRAADATSGSLRLAQEYEAAHRRMALDSLILDCVPDADYEPGELHRLLLKLPWTDVLTTNWDTLLERAAERTVERQYSIVRATEDIPHGIRPRVVKLHGSFPATRPFILTEDDFRTYPDHFGPMVNLAQQVIMENALCLIGFSGDDPNFLYWSGWVRDNLGDSVPMIYLTGLLGLSPSQRQLLESRSVRPIDLSPLFPHDQFPDSARRHALALHWFLLALEAGEPPDLLYWPEYVAPARTMPPAGLPPLIAPSYAIPRPE